MKKAERLSVAAAVAPVIRRQTEAVKKRRIYLTSPDGEVTGVTTNEELQASMLLRAQIEFDTAEGVKETHRECAVCGKPFAIDRKKTGARTCDGCRTRQTKCAGDGCEAPPHRGAFTPAVVAKRKGAPWMCFACQRATTEWREKMAEAARRRSENPEWRARSAEAQRRKFEDPEYRAKHADAVRRKFEDPEYRAKVAEAARRRSKKPEWHANVAEAARRRGEAKRAKNEQRPGAASAEGERE